MTHSLRSTNSMTCFALAESRAVREPEVRPIALFSLWLNSKRIRKLMGGHLMSGRREVRGPSRFTQADVARAIKGAKKASVSIGTIRIEPDGTILIIPAELVDVQASQPNPWDED
jgi:hypothetical protein